jgi:hypothetical protein
VGLVVFIHGRAIFALFFRGLLPFTWFVAWLITNGISWWLEMTNPGESERKAPPQ